MHHRYSHFLAYVFFIGSRTLLCYVLFALGVFKAQAQISRQSGQDFICSYYGENIDPEITLYPADKNAKQLIQQIVSVVGLKANFEIRAANVPNAAAVILDNKRYILYNSKFISDINLATRNDWAGISIIAHEIGHHLNGHTLSRTGSQPDLELEADEFSGFVLHKLGASLTDAQAAMNIAASLKASHTHPGKQDRLYAIATGWRNADNTPGTQTASAQKTDKAIVKPTVVKNPEKESPIAAQYIAFDVHFKADPKGIYYITVRGNLVSVDGESLFIIGRLGESNKKGYRLMLSDKNYNYLYIASKGIIQNGSGKNVGYIEAHR
jgi:hypothetical protein